MIVKAGSSSFDGRGGEGTQGQPGVKPAPRYLYYRLYTKEGALESNNPFYSDDRFISRVVAKYVAPPHTSASIKKHLCRIEGFEGPGNSTLYASLSATTPLEDSTRLSLRDNTGPGSTEAEPMALVVEQSALEKRLAASTVDPKPLPERGEEPRYVYYRVYEQEGQVSSKTTFNENDSSLGRINTYHIPPPHTVSSLMSCLIKAEGISSQDVQFFEDEYGETVMNDGDAIALLSDHYPGMLEDEPMSIVFESALPQASEFSKQIKIQPGLGWSSTDPSWHSTSVGEIFKTDGILRSEKMYYFKKNQECKCYFALNSAGKKAFVVYTWVDFC